MMSGVDVGGIFSLLLSRSVSRMPLCFFFFGVGVDLDVVDCCFCMFLCFFSAAACSFFSFSSCCCCSLFITSCSVNITANLVLMPLYLRLLRGGGGMGDGGAKIVSTVSTTGGEEEEERDSNSKESESWDGRVGTGGGTR